VPSNDFGGQEPGGADDIRKTAQGEYHDGHVAAAFPSDIEPMDARVIDAIAKEFPRGE